MTVGSEQQRPGIEAAFTSGPVLDLPGPAALPRAPGVIEVPEPECWLHPAVEVRASAIQGLGLFAREDIPAGVVVSRLGGRLVGQRAASRPPSTGIDRPVR
jgi:hypothetical protein